MKILIPLLLLTLGVNANEVVYGSKSGTVEPTNAANYETEKIVDVAAGETIQILNVTGGYINEVLRSTYFYIQAQYGDLPKMTWQKWFSGGGTSNGNARDDNQSRPFFDDVIVGPCSVHIGFFNSAPEQNIYQVSYKITKPSAAGTTTSAPILLPPTQDAAKSWFVKLQVSSDLKAWDDVAPGQFLGSDTARFFRIQTTEAE